MKLSLFSSSPRLAVGGATLFLTASLMACATPPKEVPPAQPANGGATAAAAPAMTGNPAAANDLPMPSMQSTVKWEAPAKWKVGPERAMRAATYLIPAAAGDSEGGECAVFVNIGGGVQANVDRWIGQFEQPDGSDSKTKAKTKTETINGLAITTIELNGTFKAGGMTMNPGAPPAAPKTNYRLLGAIVAGKSGDVFFKLTGPVKTLNAAQADFQALLQSVKE